MSVLVTNPVFINFTSGAFLFSPTLYFEVGRILYVFAFSKEKLLGVVKLELRKGIVELVWSSLVLLPLLY